MNGDGLAAYSSSPPTLPPPRFPPVDFPPVMGAFLDGVPWGLPPGPVTILPPFDLLIRDLWMC